MLHPSYMMYVRRPVTQPNYIVYQNITRISIIQCSYQFTVCAQGVMEQNDKRGRHLPQSPLLRGAKLCQV